MLLTNTNCKIGILNSLKNSTENFFYGKIYPVILALTTFLFWIANLQYVGFMTLCLIGTFLLIVYDDMLPTIPLLFFIPMSFRDTSVFVYSYTPFYFLIPVVIGLIFHFIRYQKSCPKIDLLCLGFFAIIIAMLLGGIFSDFTTDYKKGFGFIALSGIAMLAIHFVYTNRIKTVSERNTGKYACFSILCAVNLACLQLIFALIHVSLYGDSEFIFPDFCWANTNHVGNLILIAAPVCCYLLLDSKTIIPYILNLLLYYVSAFLSQSDGTIFILILATPLMLFYTFNEVHKKNFKSLKTTCFIIIPLIVLVFSYLALFQMQIIIDFFNKATMDNARSELYIYLFEKFKMNPLFGAGVGHIFSEIPIHVPMSAIGYCHSTLFFAISSTGVFGLLTFVLLYILRFRLLFKNNTTLGLFATLSFVMFALYSLIDNGEFNVVLIYMTTLITCTGILNKKGNDYTLPLIKKFGFYSLRSNIDFV